MPLPIGVIGPLIDCPSSMWFFLELVAGEDCSVDDIFSGEIIDRDRKAGGANEETDPARRRRRTATT